MQIVTRYCTESQASADHYTILYCLLSHFLDSSTEGANPGEPSVNYRSKKDNPDLVSRSITNRYRNARANNMYGDVDLQTFRDKILGDKLAKSLDRNYRMISRPSKIAAWRIPHESDMADPNAQEVQQYPQFLALKAGVKAGVQDRILTNAPSEWWLARTTTTTTTAISICSSTFSITKQATN